MKRKFSLKERHMFTRAFKRGKFTAGRLIVLHVLRSTKKDADTVVGISVSAKHGKAVKRSRVKRLIRESMRCLHGRVGSGFVFVIAAREPCYHANVKCCDVYRELEWALRKQGLL